MFGTFGARVLARSRKKKWRYIDFTSSRKARNAGSGKTSRKIVPTLDAALSFLADPDIDDDEDDVSSESQK